MKYFYFRKYSSQLKEYSDYDSRDELLTEKPAMNTLKKTFTAMLSKADSNSFGKNGLMVLLTVATT